MPRRARMYLADLTYHVVQRGNNRQPCFWDVPDRNEYLNLLAECSGRYSVEVHAFVLMSNHVHLLMTPREADGISSLMKVVASRYAQVMNKKYQRTGTLWEGRHRASAVETESYLLNCYRYVEMNPVRAGLATQPGDYPWSSHQENVQGGAPGWLTPHPVYLGLGTDPAHCAAAYRRLFDTPLDHEDLASIRKASHFCQPVGGATFLQWVAEQCGQKPGQLAVGRPKKQR